MKNKVETACEQAALRLAKSERGQNALADLQTLLKGGATGLDSENKTALSVLFLAALGANPGTVLDLCAKVNDLAVA